MLATATHDHKRVEDVRARLAVMSEFATEWAARVAEWIERCRPLQQDVKGKLTPTPGDIAILLQMVVGAWPPDLETSDTAGRAAFAVRLAQWQEKPLREAKLETDWAVPDNAYESAARELLLALVERNATPELLAAVVAFAQRLAPAGVVNGLSQTLLKLTVPGVPDIYQGTEFWDFSLVDPDNRRPVDFDARGRSLDEAPLRELVEPWRDGRIKQALIARTLAFRREHAALFSDGTYEPLEVRGRHSHRIIAFARRFERHVAVVVVPRMAARLLRAGEIGFEAAGWEDTVILVPEPRRLSNVFGPDEAVAEGPSISVGTLFRRLPVALLVSRGALMPHCT
jgi:maltooligosyltrehalose synthase